jgi:NAD-dependent protein deacetylase/lipoamidase
MNHEGIARAAEIVRGACSVVALTGAGISVPSGIPDFRGDDGLWDREDPMEVASLRAFQANPHRFYHWFCPLLNRLLSAQPNPAHQALSALERAGLLAAIVTQNIDGLHQRAGSREVYELHGHLRSATCLGCERQVPSAPLMERMRRGGIPRCDCGGLFKPDVVLFDEMLPRGLFWLSQHAIETCDVMIVAGTSLEVAPVCDMPLAALRRGARLIIVNQGETYLDAGADVVLREDVAVALPAIARRAVAA